MALSLEELEATHDYIQWLFPTYERSNFNPEAPTLQRNVAAAFQQDPVLRATFRRAFVLMLGFYGLALVEDDTGMHVRKGAAFHLRSATWLTRGNHNYLRLTRIMKSARALGEPELARALGDCLITIYHSHAEMIGERTLSYWKDALEGEREEPPR